MAEPAYLIVNADDYGYFPCVSRGILAAGRGGVVTATGILANAPHLEEHLGWLASAPGLDLGVHLCLTSGAPLSHRMRQRLHRFGGRFPRKELTSAALLTGVIRIADVREEWQRQIEACLDHGLDILFVNSHEHIHMLPPLFTLIHELARAYGIAHVRFPQSDGPRRRTAGALTRNLVIGLLGRLQQKRGAQGHIPCLGLGASGNLGFDDLQDLVAGLRRGGVYELMCHPGYFAHGEIADPRLRRYHNWQGELELLTSEATAALFAQHDVHAIGYRDLPVRDLSPDHRERGQ
jgi:predicted glycoside hydrolase/deacetylase ChbG (UPF0249 family)